MRKPPSLFKTEKSAPPPPVNKITAELIKIVEDRIDLPDDFTHTTVTEIDPVRGWYRINVKRKNRHSLDVNISHSFFASYTADGFVFNPALPEENNNDSA